MRSRRSFSTSSRALLALLAAVSAAGCTNEASTEPGDKPADAGTPSALGSGLTIAEMNTPGSPVAPAVDQQNVYVTGATFLTEDHYAETGLAASVGAIYMQDFHDPSSPAPPYSGVQLYKATFEPASLVLAEGDVVDFIGEYQPFYGVPEMYEPIVTFRFDYSPPTPRVIDITDLETTQLGSQWINMLVTVTNTTGGGWNVGSKQGECEVYLTSNQGQMGVAMDNELFDLPCSSGTYSPDGGVVTFTSVTGIVTLDYNFRISPRSTADIVIGG